MIALAHGDGTDWPNFAILTLTAGLKAAGEEVRLVRAGDRRELWDNPSRVLGSSVFSFSAPTRAVIDREWGPVTWGGTGIWRRQGRRVVDMGPLLSSVLPGNTEALAPDYSLYPAFTPSMGFTQRGCRLTCGFCVVPAKEGRPRAVRSVPEIWRGPGHPRTLLILDNDPFGQPPEEWRARLREIREGDFRVCFAQGINVRLVDEESACELATVRYSNVRFNRRRLYTAWDNLGDEAVFKSGVQTLAAAGIPPKHLMVYMLVGFDPRETWERILYRFSELVSLGCLPYPMVYERERAAKNSGASPETRAHVKKLLAFARWASTGLYRAVAWEDYDVRIKRSAR